MLNFFRKFIILSIFLFWVGSVSANGWDYIAKGSQLLKMGKEEKAILEFEKALDVKPSMIEAYQKIGYVYQYKIKDYQKAIQFYLKGLKYKPDNYQLNLNLMYAFFEVNQIEKALETYEKAAKIRPENKRFSFPIDKLKILFKGMDVNNKIQFCKEKLELNPTDTSIRKSLADIYLERKSYQKAKNQYEALITYGGDSGNTYYGLGITNFYLEEYSSAFDYLKKAKELGEYVPDQYFEMVKNKMQSGAGGP